MVSSSRFGDLSIMFIDIAKFFIWLWRLVARKKSEQPSQQTKKQTEQVRLLLRQTLSKLNCHRIILFKLSRMVRRGHAEEDARRNGLLMVTAVDEMDTPPPPTADLPISLDVADMFDMEHLPETMFAESWEWPDRAKMNQDSNFCSCMREHGAMGCICWHLFNNQGSVVGMMAVCYSDAHEITDADRDKIRLTGRQLPLLLPWLDGG